MIVRDINVARRATVRICNESGDHFGQGLLLLLPLEGWIVLTCHHVVAQLDAEHLFVAVPDILGTLSLPIKAYYDADRSRPSMDAAVLRITDLVPFQEPFDQPLLHRLNPFTYDGTLPERAVCLGHWKGNSFDARLSTTTQLNITVENPGPWPNPPARYQLPFVFRLADPTDARPGISGSVVLYEKGVLGLTHFSRPAGSDQEREVYLVPLSVWGDGWPALQRLIEPLIDSRLRHVAKVKSVNSIGIGTDIIIAGYRNDIYMPLAAEQQARNALENVGGVIIVGKPKSGKTRLAWQLIQERKDALVVIPFDSRPPTHFETSALIGQQIILFFDDLHRTTLSTDPLEWRRRMEVSTGQRCLVICTTRDGKDLKRVEENAPLQLFDILGKESYVYTSRSGNRGNDLNKVDGILLANQLGIDQSEFIRRFDGTVGSLTLDLTEMHIRYKRLCDEERGGISMSRLLDAAKIAYEASQPCIRISVLKMIAEQLRGDGPLSAEAWEVLQRRTSEEGFGFFDKAGDEIQTYKPYLETCVDIQPSRDDFKKLILILTELKDGSGLLYLGYAFLLRFNDNEEAERCFRLAIDMGYHEAGTLLGTLLSEKDIQKEEFETYCRQKIEEGIPNFYLGLARILSKKPGNEIEAEEAFKKALDNYKTKLYKRIVKNLYGIFLAGIQGRDNEAEALLREASNDGEVTAYHSLVIVISRQPGRKQESIELIDNAIKQWSEQVESDESSEEIAGKHYGLSGKEEKKNDLNKLLYYKANLLVVLQENEAEAERLLKEAIEKGIIDAYLTLGVLFLRQPGRLKDAEFYYQKGIEANIKECVYGLGVTLVNQPDRFEDAKGYFWMSIQQGNITAYRELGVILGKQNRLQEAEQFLRMAEDSGVDIQTNLGLILQVQPGRELEALAAYKRQMAKESKEAYLCSLELLNNHKELRKFIEKHLRDAISLGFDSASRDLAIHLASRVVVDGANYLTTEAVKRLQDLAKNRDPLVKEVLGGLFLHLERYSEAKIILEQAKAEGSERAGDLLVQYGLS